MISLRGLLTQQVQAPLTGSCRESLELGAAGLDFALRFCLFALHLLMTLGLLMLKSDCLLTCLQQT